MKTGQESDYINLLKPSINSVSRIIIFIVLSFSCVGFIFISTLTTSLPWLSDLAINLSAGSVGSLATIFIIDYLINKEKTSKLIAVNKLNHHGLLSYIRILMIRIMNDLNYVSKKETLSYMDNAEDKFTIFIGDEKIVAKLEVLNKLSKNNLLLIRKMNKTLGKGWEYLAKNIKDFKPYPDPLLTHKINVEMTYNSGAVSVGEEVFSLYFDKLPKKISKNEIDEMKPGMTVLWKIVASGLEDPSKSYKNYYLSSFNFLLQLSERCKNENVFFNV